MRYCLYTNIVSPHQLPLAREIVKRVGAENFRYVHTEDFHAERAGLGWQAESESWIVQLPANLSTSQHPNTSTPQAWLENCDVLICCLRDLDLIERRCKRGLKTFYSSERWFKPILPAIQVSGCLRILHPSYFRMVRRFVGLVRRYECFRLLPIGVHARNDFRRMGVPDDKMTLWGYFVSPSETKKVGGESRWTKDGAAPPVDAFVSNASDSFPANSNNPTITQSNNSLRVLYVGRLIPLKRVDTIIRAVALANQTIQQSNNQTISPITLTIVGDGPEKSRLQALTQSLSASIKNQPSAVHLLSPPTFSFIPSVPISTVRALMRQHDVLVFASNAEEGWGAVVSEALEEGMLVLGSDESGAPATVLPPSHRFHCRDYKRLAHLLQQVGSGALRTVAIGPWTAARAAESLFAL